MSADALMCVKGIIDHQRMHDLVELSQHYGFDLMEGIHILKLDYMIEPVAHVPILIESAEPASAVEPIVNVQLDAVVKKRRPRPPTTDDQKRIAAEKRRAARTAAKTSKALLT